MRSASTSTTVPARSASTTSPVSTAARYSSPVPISGGSVIMSGPACAQRRQPAPVREPGERVRLIHELRELRGAEELLERSHDRPDVDDRLRRDRVDVLRRHPLADDSLHAVEPDPERLLDQLADGAEPPVAEVLVLVQVAADRIAGERDCVGGE